MGSNSNLEAIGKRIAEQRQKNNLTQAELASRVSVSREIINYWENGSRDIKTGNIVLLAEALNTTCDYLLQGVESNNVDIHRSLGLSNASIDFLKKLNSYKSNSNAPDLIGAVNVLIENKFFGEFVCNIFSAMLSAENVKKAWNAYHATYAVESVEKDDSNYLSALNSDEFRKAYEADEEFEARVFRLIKSVIKITDDLKEGGEHDKKS